MDAAIAADRFLQKPHLQLLFGLTDILPGLLEPLLHFSNLLLKLSATFCLIHLQEKMVPPLQGVYLRWECNDLVSDPVPL